MNENSKKLNTILAKTINEADREETKSVVRALVTRMTIEYEKNDRSGIYARTQTDMAYNSNKIEGSTLTPDQTSSLFHTGTLRSDGETAFRAKDIEEMTGHFAMFSFMLQTWNQPLSEKLIKEYHYKLKARVFEDMANGYPIGEYKNRVNFVSDITVAHPDAVHGHMCTLIERYEAQPEITVMSLAKFHADYEKVHPFQDGNGRTGRMLLFKECLRGGMIPIIIKDSDKEQYYHGLNKAQKENDYSLLVRYFESEQKLYYEKIKEFLWDYSVTQGNHCSAIEDADAFLSTAHPGENGDPS